MGIFAFIRKEIMINRLVKNYKDIFYCDDMSAIKNLRYNYSAEELKEILDVLRKSPIHIREDIKSLFKPHNSLL